METQSTMGETGKTKTGYIVFGHGSSVESANEAVRAVTREFARQGGFPVAETAFLELGKPSLAQAIEKVAEQAAHIVVVPYFLTLGIHLKRDLPKLIEEAERAHPGLTIEVTPPMDQHPAMIGVLLDRANAASRKGDKA